MSYSRIEVENILRLLKKNNLKYLLGAAFLIIGGCWLAFLYLKVSEDKSRLNAVIIVGIPWVLSCFIVYKQKKFTKSNTITCNKCHNLFNEIDLTNSLKINQCVHCKTPIYEKS